MDARAEQDEQRRYLALVEQARRLGLPTSLDDPRTPRTSEGLADAITYHGRGLVDGRADSVPLASEMDGIRAQCQQDARYGAPYVVAYAIGYLRGSRA